MKLFPMLVLELYSHCNRSCSFCARTHDRSGARNTPEGDPVMRKMPTDQAERLLREARDLGFRGATTFYLYSEPFLDSRIIHFADMAKRFGMYTFANTNGDVLKRDEKLRQQAAEVFGHIEIALYDCSTRDEMEHEIRWWSQNMEGCNLVFRGLDSIGYRPGNKMVTPPGGGVCNRPDEKLIILYDGRSALCCYDLEAEWNFPNAFHTSLRDLWWCEKREYAITTLAAGNRAAFPLCSTCAMPAGRQYPAGGGWENAPLLKLRKST